jgi:nitrate reductase alpha subunit
VWGEQTDVHESADWYNARFIAVMGSNLNMTRTPDTHFISEVRHAGAKLTVFSPDFSQVAKYADYWIPVHAGQDAAFWMAVNHVLLKEFTLNGRSLLCGLPEALHRHAVSSRIHYLTTPTRRGVG